MSSTSHAWVDEPNGRGTWGLIQSCLVTLFLCIYTAIHLNIRPYQSKRKSWLRRIGASLLASAMPEFMVVCAISQWSLAKQLQSQLNHVEAMEIECERCKQFAIPKKTQSPHQETQPCRSTNSGAPNSDENHIETDGGSRRRAVRRSGTLNELERGTSHMSQESLAQHRVSYATFTRQGSSTPPTSRSEKPPRYTLGQAFFIVAGGLAIETKSFREEPYLTVTPRGAVELARLGLLKPVPAEVIDDKTKADPITKVVVCIQAGWFIIQCIARVAQKLPLTLLEIHTLAHVFIALLMYLFWFPKPYNALSPIVITDPMIVETAALFTLNNLDGTEETKSARCVLRDEFNTVSVKNSHFGLAGKVRYPTNDEPSSIPSKGIKIVPTSDQQRESEGALPSANERVTESFLTPPANEDDNVSEDLAKSNAHHQITSNASTISPSIHDGPSEEPRVDGNLWASERGSSSTEAHNCVQGQVASQSLQTDVPALEPRLKEPLPSNAHSSPGTTNHGADTTLSLAHLAIQHLKSNKVHFVYFEVSGESIQHRSTYLVPLIADFDTTPGCKLSNSDLRSKEQQSRSRSVYNVLPSQPRSTWVYLLFISYGTFHLGAWNAHFPTILERWMWRGAGLIVVGSSAQVLVLGPLSALIVRPLETVDSLAKKFTQPVVMILHILKSMLYSTSLSVFIFYLLSSLIVALVGRFYFLVEAFISLREPAPRNYETVEWTQFWPHG